MTTDLHPDTRQPRPGTCCGACPPIAGVGWDCTCPGMPGCPANAPGLVRARRERDAVAQDLARMAARLAAVEAAFENLPLLLSAIEKDQQRTPQGRGGEVHFIPATPGHGKSGCPGDNITRWLNEVRAALDTTTKGESR